MFCTSTHPPLQQRPIHTVWRNTARVAVTALLLIAPRMASAQAEADFEQPPVLTTSDLVSASLLKGQGFRVDDKVPTDGVMGVFTIKADATTFGEDAGTYQVRSRELLQIRLAEIPAIEKLDETVRPTPLPNPWPPVQHDRSKPRGIW